MMFNRILQIILTVIVSKMKSVLGFGQKRPPEFLQLVCSMSELLIYAVWSFLVRLYISLLCRHNYSFQNQVTLLHISRFNFGFIAHHNPMFVGELSELGGFP